MEENGRADASITDLDERSREIFRGIVESYMMNGTPSGSRTLSRLPNVTLSPASIRNVMADLEAAGLLFAPHTSAGRLPTDRGLRLFVDGLLEVGDLTVEERASIEGRCADGGHGMQDILQRATEILSGLSQCAGVVAVPKFETPLKHIEFVHLGAGRAIVVLVTETGVVENRLIELGPGVPPSALIEAANYLNDRLQGRTFEEARGLIQAELEARRSELDTLTRKIVEAGLATWAGEGNEGSLIVRGHAKLLDDVSAVDDLERVRQLFADLENAREYQRMLDLARDADGVRIFIGSENRLFSLSGSSLIVAPYTDGKQRLVGAIGVIGPTHLNYARIIPMVDYTAQVIGRLIG